ncbi:MAG: chorismate synthase [Candidatus Omnitrophota bacterium]
MIRYMTAGESHGRALTAIVDGIPSGLAVEASRIDRELKRRMAGYGRGGRMKIEKDRAVILSGVRKGRTTGAPVCILIENKDFAIDRLPAVTKARPGHADLAGAMKYGAKDIRDVLERASARETAARVAVGAVARMLLGEFRIDVMSHVVSIGPVKADTGGLTFLKLRSLAEGSSVRCADRRADALMKKEIDKARLDGDTLGGVCEIVIKGAPAGLGSYAAWDLRLDAGLARCLMSIPAVKGVEIGAGFEASGMRGSCVHDEISYDGGNGFSRRTNRAGGLEGGVTNGEDIVLKIAMKPIATLMKPLSSVDIISKKAARAAVERADVCAVPACGVIDEAVAAIEIAGAMAVKFGGDSVAEMKRNFSGYMSQLRRF